MTIVSKVFLNQFVRNRYVSENKKVGQLFKGN